MCNVYIIYLNIPKKKKRKLPYCLYQIPGNSLARFLILIMVQTNSRKQTNLPI